MLIVSREITPRSTTEVDGYSSKFYVLSPMLVPKRRKSRDRSSALRIARVPESEDVTTKKLLNNGT